MAPLSLKIVLDEGAVTRTILFDSSTKVSEAHHIIKEKLPTGDDGKDYGLFLTSADEPLSGIWLEGFRNLEYYMLRDGDHLHYLTKQRNLRVRMLDGSVKTLQVDESKSLGDLMLVICHRIGITNHDEYGLCHEETVAEEKEPRSTGTLTLKRKAQQKDRDAKMDQLSKKLKTDDNVEWLDQHKTLREMGVDPKETLLLKRRLFYSDRNVDARDPVQLNLLYVQTRNAILDGRHPVTEAQATEFAAIQCQIHFGDFQEDKHKPGLIENLNEYLPEQYSSSWGAEKRILKSYRKHHGLSQVDAKCLYTKTARDLPTYGVTFFLVKEKQKGKKKLVPRLLGINSESVLRLDELTKEILQAWPLTQVRTYHVGKSDSFTLNFGDYSEKEYSVKTNEAHRIRDILEGYIDLIRRRLGAPYGASHPDSAVVMHDNVEVSRGNVITHVTNTPSKVVEQSFIGPSRILPFEQGSEAMQGTQIMTVQQVVVTSRGTGDQHVVTGEVPMRKDMSPEYVKKLNRMNSNSVQVVTLLTDPTEDGVKQAQSIVNAMQRDLPDIIKGVKETASKQTNEEAQRKLLKELDDLCDYLNRLAADAGQDNFNAEGAQESARRIADLTTIMYFSLDPRTKRRSEFVRRSRQSFVADAAAAAAQQHDSLAAAAADALHAATHALTQEHRGPVPTDHELEELETAAVDKMERLNAAVALYLTAHSDPENMEYSAAVSSMNTINELLPELANDAARLGSVSGEESRRALLDQIRALCGALCRLCALSATGDQHKMKEAADAYGDVSGKLIYTFGRRNRRGDADTEKEGSRQSLPLGEAGAPLSAAAAGAAGSAAGSVHAATVLLSQECSGPELGELELHELQVSQLEMQGRLGAAAARYVAAYSDPKNIDYSVAVASMNTINEVLPEFAKVLQEHSMSYNVDQRKEFLDHSRALIVALGELCARAAAGECDKVNDAANSYADVADELMYRNSCSKIVDMRKMMELSEEVGQSTTQLLVKVNELTTLAAAEPAAPGVDDAGVACADAARDLITTVKVTAHTIHDPHCQSAVTAAAESLSSSAQRLAAAWRPLMEVPGRGHLAEELDNCNTELARALDRLRNCYSYFPKPETAAQRAQRVRLYQSAELGRGVAKAFMDEIHDASFSQSVLCCTPSPEIIVPLQDHEARELEAGISNKARRINAAVLAFVPALSDPHNPDYESAEKAMAIINELLPDVIKDTKTLASSYEDPTARDAMRQNLFRYCIGIEAVCIDCSHDKVVEVEDAARLHARMAHNLSFGVTPNRARQQLLMQLLNAAEQRAKAMANGADVMAGERARARAQLVRARADALRSAVQITAPAIREADCRAALFASVDSLSSSARELVSELSETTQLQGGETLTASLQQKEEIKKHGEELEKYLGWIRDVYREAANGHDVPEDGGAGEGAGAEAERLRFVSSALAAARGKRVDGELFDVHYMPSPTQLEYVKLEEREIRQLEADVSDKVTRINAAVAALLPALSDPHNPDYESAEKAMAIINELLPDVIKDTKTLSLSCEDESEREAIRSARRAWCDGILGVCYQFGNGRFVEPDDAAHAYARVSQKLSFVFSPRANKSREQLLGELSAAAEQRAMAMADGAYEMAGGAGGAGARAALRGRATGARAAAHALRVATQLTAPTIHEPHCQAALLTAAESLSSSARELVSETAQLQDDETGCRVLEARLHKQRVEVQQHGRDLEKYLEGIRETCRDAANTKSPKKPPVPVRSSTLQARDPAAAETGSKATTTAVAKAVPTASTAPTAPTAGSATQDFLHQLRCEESHNKENLPPIAFAETATKKIEKAKTSSAKKVDKRIQKQFAKTVEDGEKTIDAAADELKKVYSTQSPLIEAESGSSVAAKKAMEHKLARAGVAAAALVATNHPDSMDYAVAAESAGALAELMANVTKDAATLSDSGNEKSRRLLLAETLALCDATKRLCAAANSDREKLNEEAIAFGDKSARLLYIISTDVDPAQEKDVIVRARAVGDSASRLARGGAGVAGAGAGEGAGAEAGVCEAGCALAAAASTLVYTAKLVAPSIHHPECQNSLIVACDDLSSRLGTFKSTWQPLSSDPQHTKSIAELATEADVLEKLLEGFKEDLAGGKLVKRREVEKVLIEDTALRQLALKILEDAKKRAESPEASEEKRRKFADYANKLTEAVRRLDLANSRCRLQPHELNKRRELENAVQNLQVTLLQARPTSGDQPQNNIVDLTDYVNNLSLEAKNLTETANMTKVTQGGKALESVKEECQKIEEEAYRLVHPTDQPQDGDLLDEILEVDQFGRDCEKRVQSINAAIQELGDANATRVLLQKATALSESCNLLRFATNSALATARSAALDETLDDLAHLETGIDHMLLPAEGATTCDANTNMSPPSLMGARARLAVAAARVSRGAAHAHAPDAAPALHAYAAEMRARTDLSDPQERSRLKAHLQKLVAALRELTAAAGARVAVWQPVDCGEVAACTQHLLKELESPANGIGQTDQIHKKVVNEDDILKLLLPSETVKINGDQKQVEAQLQQTATKLGSLTGTVVLSSAKPESLARSLHAVADVAGHLDAVARAVAANTRNSVHKKRIEEAAQEMRFATYNLLKTSELVSQDPNNPGCRRRLLDACRLLTESINKLTRTSSSASELQKDCNELIRCLQARHNLLQTGHPTCALTYSHCVDALCNQQEVIQKLNSEAAMTPEELRETLGYVAGAAGNGAAHAAHCAYLISMSEKQAAGAPAGGAGPVDGGRVQRVAAAAHDACLRVGRARQLEQVKHEETALKKQVEDLQEVIQDAASKTDGDDKRALIECGSRVEAASKALNSTVYVKTASLANISTRAMSLADAIRAVDVAMDRASAAPQPDPGAEAQALRDEVITSSRTLLSKTQALVKDVSSRDAEGQQPMTWVMYGGGRSAAAVVEAFEALLNTLRQNGHRAGLIELPKAEESEDADAKKSYVQILLELAKKWLQRKPSKPEVEDAGEKAVRNIIEIAEKMAEDLKGQEKEEMRHLIAESEQLVGECANKYDSDKANVLLERVRELCRAVERGAVARVVEHFAGAEAPLADLDVLADAERDEVKRKFLLEKKIAELLAQLGRVTRTARLVADANGGGPVRLELKKCTDQTELLAPMLVKAAQGRVSSPDDAAAVEHYRSLLAQYAASLANIRDLCDSSVDPLDFVQTAGETMQRMREESSQSSDPQICAYTSIAIRRLARRVIHVGLSSSGGRSDPELRTALAEAERRLTAAEPAPDARASRQPDWRDTTAEILRTTGEVESVLGGENIFRKQPEPDQPIYNAALGLHAAVREWSARDNEIVAVAKRMAVLMARLSDHMNTDKKRELISTSKAIVSESHEVARLARKLALECTDLRIRTNLLQVCERIPTISGQLKMLTTVKGSSLGRQGTEEDKEAMNMLVGNAQNLMLSVQEVVKAAASASVRIASQRGVRMRWVRRAYY